MAQESPPEISATCENQCQSLVLLFSQALDGEATGSRQGSIFVGEDRVLKNLVGVCPCAIVSSER